MIASFGRGLVAGLLLLAAAPVGGQIPVPPTLREEAQALLQRGIPVALILGSDRQGELQARASQPRGAEPADDRRALLTGLAARWAGRVDVFDDGTVVTLRARMPACVRQLERTFDATGIVAPPFQVVHAIAARLNPRIAPEPPPGMLGGGVSSLEPREEAAREEDGRTVAILPVSLGGGTTSLHAALNELAIKAGRLGWAIGSERDAEGRAVCRIALLTRSSTVVSFDEIPPP
jgi:hypothetical protein